MYIGKYTSHTDPTVDGSESPNNHLWDVRNVTVNPVNHGDTSPTSTGEWTPDFSPSTIGKYFILQKKLAWIAGVNFGVSRLMYTLR